MLADLTGFPTGPAQLGPLQGTYLNVAGAIAAGFVMTALVRMLVRRVRSITWSTSALLATVAGSLAFALASIREADSIVLSVLLALGLTAVFLLIATVFEQRYRPAPDVHGTQVAELIRLGESAAVEFKSTARRNLHTDERDPAIEAVVARTVCGFLNGRGGTLLIGVTDDGEVIGIGTDLPLMKFPDADGYELFLTDLLRTTLGLPALSCVRVRFEATASGTGGDGPGSADPMDSGDPADLVCRVDVDPSPVPVYLTPPKGTGGSREPEFWVRAGNGTRALRMDELLDYHRSRWGGWLRRTFGG